MIFSQNQKNLTETLDSVSSTEWRKTQLDSVSSTEWQKTQQDSASSAEWRIAYCHSCESRNPVILYGSSGFLCGYSLNRVKYLEKAGIGTSHASRPVFLYPVLFISLEAIRPQLIGDLCLALPPYVSLRWSGCKINGNGEEGLWGRSRNKRRNLF